MTLNSHLRRDRRRTTNARVWLDGVEVTDRCFYADGRRGIVRLYALDAHGRKHTDATGESLATEERRGHVRWGRRAEA
jgi:hypothetical protein